MEDSSFTKMEKRDVVIIGNRQLIVCGFKPKDQTLLKKIVKKCHISVDLFFPTDLQKELTLNEINELPAGSGEGDRSTLCRSIIAAGITEKEFHRLLERYKKSSLDRPLWATLTETSCEWKLSRLLNELSRERAMMG